MNILLQKNKEANIKRLKVEPCPFCGEDPIVRDNITVMTISCCSYMHIKKSKVITGKEKRHWSKNKKKWIYSDYTLTKIFNLMIEKWNKRMVFYIGKEYTWRRSDK